jgi:hypothetical protein
MPMRDLVAFLIFQFKSCVVNVVCDIHETFAPKRPYGKLCPFFVHNFVEFEDERLYHP